MRGVAASDKQDLGLKSSEGKKFLYFQAYKRLAEIIFRSKKIEHIAAHTFIVLEWNLIARAENCLEAKVEHISFHRDALLFDFAKTKIDQEGIKNIDDPWHVYENNLEPVVFTLPALAHYIIVHPSILTGQSYLFKGHYQYERFKKIFNEVVVTH